MSKSAKPPENKPLPISDLGKKKLANMAANSAKPIVHYSTSEATQTVGFSALKLILALVSIVVDFVTNLVYTSQYGGVTPMSFIFAFLLMITDIFVIYFAYRLVAQFRKKEWADFIRTLIIFGVSLAGLYVDFMATVEPVRQSLNPTTEQAWHLANFAGVLVAVYTSYFQAELFPSIMSLIKRPEDKPPTT
jgi:hypothetical protein